MDPNDQNSLNTEQQEQKAPPYLPHDNRPFPPGKAQG